jgi:hypothetical protein
MIHKPSQSSLRAVVLAKHDQELALAKDCWNELTSKEQAAVYVSLDELVQQELTSCWLIGLLAFSTLGEIIAANLEDEQCQTD